MCLFVHYRPSTVDESGREWITTDCGRVIGRIAASGQPKGWPESAAAGHRGATALHKVMGDFRIRRTVRGRTWAVLTRSCRRECTSQGNQAYIKCWHAFCPAFAVLGVLEDCECIAKMTFLDNHTGQPAHVHYSISKSL